MRVRAAHRGGEGRAGVCSRRNSADFGLPGLPREGNACDASNCRVCARAAEVARDDDDAAMCIAQERKRRRAYRWLEGSLGRSRLRGMRSRERL